MVQMVKVVLAFSWTLKKGILEMIEERRTTMHRLTTKAKLRTWEIGLTWSYVYHSLSLMHLLAAV